MKKFLAILLSAAMLLSLCGVAVAEASGDAIDPELIAAAQAEGELTVYASCEEAYMNVACDHFQELYGITVNRQRLSTGEVAAKIEEENGNPSGDVWFGATRPQKMCEIKVSRASSAAQRLFERGGIICHMFGRHVAGDVRIGAERQCLLLRQIAHAQRRAMPFQHRKPRGIDELEQARRRR